MLNIAKQTIDFYMKNLKIPEVNDLSVENTALLSERSSNFITIYHKWNIRGSGWNIKEIKENTVSEIIENTIHAISKDSRFKALTMSESKEIKIRIDKIIARNILKDKSIKQIDPTINGIIVIKKDYSKIACILPNINPLLLTWEDFIPVLKEKLKEKNFVETDYIIYEITTKVETDY